MRSFALPAMKKTSLKQGQQKDLKKVHEISQSLAFDENSIMEETFHFLSTPANAERIRCSLEEYAQGNLQEHELCD